MKKFVSMLLTLALIAALLVGCASQSATTTTSSASTASASAETSASKAETTASASAETETSAEASADTSAEDTAAVSDPNEVITLRTTFESGEFAVEQIEMYEAEHENIKIEQISADTTKLMSMIAAGTAPDLLRVVSVQELPSFATRGIVSDAVGDYVEAGKGEYIKNYDDMLPVYNAFRWDAENCVAGQGKLYGFVKDFSNDLAIFANKTLLEEAGVEVQDYNTPMTYTELGEICKKVQKMDGATPVVYGMTPADGEMNSIWRILLYNKQAGESPWKDNYTGADFSNPATMAYMNWAVDLIQTGSSVSSVIMQAPNGDNRGAYASGAAAMTQCGYWYTGSLRSNEQTKDKLDELIFLPQPQIDNTQRVTACTSAVGGSILRASKHPDETFQLMDWFFGGSPATDRAKSGWGLPVFKSMMDLLPTDTEFDQIAKEVALADAENMQMLDVNPYIAPATMTNLIAKYLPPVYSGDSTLEDAVAGLNEELAPLIAEGMEIAGAKK